MRIAVVLMSCFLMVACEKETPPPAEAATVAPAVNEDNSLQAANDARAAREALPGRAHYEKHCALCHNGNVKKAPHREMLALMTADAILQTVSTGIMQAEASMLSDAEKREVASYISSTELGAEIVQLPLCEDGVAFEPNAGQGIQNWGIQPTNTRQIDAGSGGITAANISGLQKDWAVAFPGANRVRSQPTFAGGLMFVGSHNGGVYALSEDSGCNVWHYQASGEVRTGITIGEFDGEVMLFFGDVLSNVYGVKAATGELVWKMRADDHPNATITGAPSLAGDRLYVPVSALEVSLAADPGYACCTFRGSVVAVDARTGERAWKTYTIAEPPAVTGQTAVGTDIIGPSGAMIWNSPSIDRANNQLFIGTGENMSSPASLTSDSILAMDLESGKINWVYQATANDVWNGACDTTSPENCPVEDGPDFDFGGATVLVDTPDHGPLVVAGQKSGFVHALNPVTGTMVWQTRVGRGGIQGGIHFGIAASGDTLLIPISDMADGRSYPNPDRPGMHAVNANTGEILWSTLHDDNCGERKFCHPGISQVPTVIGDLVVAGSMDGMARAYSIASGEIVWSLDTTQTFGSTLGTDTHGGSMGGAAGPVASHGRLVLSSGYGLYNHMPGNLLLVLRTTEDK